MTARTLDLTIEKLVACLLIAALMPGTLFAAETAAYPTGATTTDSEAIQESVSPPPSAKQIAAWIKQLDDDQYVVREQATAELLGAGGAVLDPLLATANGDRPEPADRAVWVLRKLSIGQDAAVRRLALERLVQLKHRPQVVTMASEALASLRHQDAIRIVKDLGAHILSSPYPEMEAQAIVPRVVLDEKWRGDDSDFKHFADLTGLQQVIIIGAEVSRDGLAELANVELLESLWLYSTKITQEEKADLEKLMPRVTLDYRRGALLGIGPASHDGLGPVRVGNVQAESAAANAGIRIHDMVKSFNGQEVEDFKDLTAKIAEYLPGDEVKLEITRGEETLDLTVKLGGWSAEQILNQRLPR